MTDRERRASERQERRQESFERQKRANEQTYGKDSALLEQANERAAEIFDINTEAQVTDNKMGTDERIENDGIDDLDSTGGFSTAQTFELDVVKDDNTAGRAVFNGSGVV